MEPRQTKPTDTSRQSAAWAESWHPEEDLYAGTGEGSDAGEDWRVRYGSPPPPRPGPGPDFSALIILLDGLRRAAPAELQGRLSSLIRESLLTLRSLIDWYLERLDGNPPEPEVENIPID